MNKIGEKLVLLFMTLQAAVVSGFYFYSKAQKWNIREEMTVFIYPFFSLLVTVLLILSALFTLAYSVQKVKETKKIYFLLPMVLMVILVGMAATLFSENNLREYNFVKYQEAREAIVESILEGELLPEENGMVSLPEDMQDEDMTRGGQVYIVSYNGQSGIYFCTFTGVMESSAGYVFLTDKSVDVSMNNKIVLQKQYEKGWYYCGTD